MRITKDKKEAVLSYILEKIDSNDNVVQKTMEAFDISRKTVFKYIDELLSINAIKRIKRGEYVLSKSVSIFSLSREKGELNREEVIFVDNVEPIIAGLPQNVKNIWEYVFSEMMNNAIDHSNAKKVTVSVIKDFANTTIIMCDNGVGIFKKIKDFFGYDSLDDAISELFKGKLTTDSLNHSGEGIFFSSRVMDEFVIISDGKVFSHNKYDMTDISSLEDYAELERVISNKGTILYMSLSNKSTKRIVDVFNKYSDVENGFIKTDIVLRNIFSSAPISRSQAKRLCERLSDFNEVELDFEGIEWMGQGFAHQLFVVFKNNNPKVKLIPLKMSEDVEKMYNHVVNTKYK